MSKWVKILFILGLSVFLNRLTIFAVDHGTNVDEVKILSRVIADNHQEHLRGTIQSQLQLVAADTIDDSNLATGLPAVEDNKANAETINADESSNKTGNVTNTSSQNNSSPKKPSNLNQNTSKELPLSPEKVDSVDITPIQPIAKETFTSQITLETIIAGTTQWWVSTPLAQQIWYIFLLTGLVLYIFKLKQLRRPLLFASIMLLGFYLGSSLDPIGAIFSLIPTRNINLDGAIILLGIIVCLSLIFGRIYCGWVCPIGAIQEFIYPELGRQILPARLDTLLKYMKFIIVIGLLFLSWYIGNNLWESYEPLKTLVHFGGSAIAIFVLIFILIVSVLIERPFCRYICPLGAILSLTAKIAPFQMRADANHCMVCGKCATGDCSMNAIQSLNPVIDLPQIDGTECISCLRCQRNCQRAALRISFKRINRVQNV